MICNSEFIIILFLGHCYTKPVEEWYGRVSKLEGRRGVHAGNKINGTPNICAAGARCSRHCSLNLEVS